MGVPPPPAAEYPGRHSTPPMPQQRYEDDVEEQLDQWVSAKKDRDFERADAIRADLRARGVNPDAARPSPGTGGGYGGHGHGGGHHGSAPRNGHFPGGYRTQTFSSDIEAELDRWVRAKRERDFGTADAIRNNLRLKGVDPNQARPSDRDLESQRRSRGVY